MRLILTLAALFLGAIPAGNPAELSATKWPAIDCLNGTTLRETGPRERGR